MPEGVLPVGGFFGNEKGPERDSAAAAVAQIVETVCRHGDVSRQKTQCDLSRGQDKIAQNPDDADDRARAIAGIKRFHTAII